MLYVDFENMGHYDMKNTRVTATIIDMPHGVVGDAGVMRRGIGPREIDTGDSLTAEILLVIPEDVELGYYVVKITITDGNIRRVKYREFEVI